MNDQAITLFLNAQFDGVKQLRNTGVPMLKDGKGFHPIALLLHAVECDHLLLPNDWLDSPKNKRAHQKCLDKVVNTFDIDREEWLRVEEENDQGFDFMTIAWMHSEHSSFAKD